MQLLVRCVNIHDMILSFQAFYIRQDSRKIQIHVIEFPLVGDYFEFDDESQNTSIV